MLAAYMVSVVLWVYARFAVVGHVYGAYLDFVYLFCSMYFISSFECVWLSLCMVHGTVPSWCDVNVCSGWYCCEFQAVRVTSFVIFEDLLALSACNRGLVVSGSTCIACDVFYNMLVLL